MVPGPFFMTMLNEKNIIIAGDSLELSLSFDGYDPSEWDVWIALRGNSQSINIKTGESGVDIDTSAGNFDIVVDPAATAEYIAGDYQYAIIMYQSEIQGEGEDAEEVITERKTVERGMATVMPDLTAFSGDTRSHVKKVLDAIEAVIENRATKDQMSYSIAGRSLSKTPLPDLERLRDRYRYEYNMEVRAMNGLGLKQARIKL